MSFVLKNNLYSFLIFRCCLNLYHLFVVVFLFLFSINHDFFNFQNIWVLFSLVNFVLKFSINWNCRLIHRFFCLFPRQFFTFLGFLFLIFILFTQLFFLNPKFKPYLNQFSPSDIKRFLSIFVDFGVIFESFLSFD